MGIVTRNCGVKLVAEFGDAFSEQVVIGLDLDKQTPIDDHVGSVAAIKFYAFVEFASSFSLTCRNWACCRA